MIEFPWSLPRSAVTYQDGDRYMHAEEVVRGAFGAYLADNWEQMSEYLHTKFVYGVNPPTAGSIATNSPYHGFHHFYDLIKCARQIPGFEINNFSITVISENKVTATMRVETEAGVSEDALVFTIRGEVITSLFHTIGNPPLAAQVYNNR